MHPELASIYRRSVREKVLLQDRATGNLLHNSDEKLERYFVVNQACVLKSKSKMVGPEKALGFLLLFGMAHLVLEMKQRVGMEGQPRVEAHHPESVRVV
jgi:hypothetical protein